MKASVITLHTVNNYGSVMQTYATQQVLKELGYEVEFVDYWRKDNLPRYRAEKLLTSNTFKKLKPIWGMNKFTKKLATICVEKIMNNQKSPMWLFVQKSVNLTKKRYYSFEELLQNPPEADVYITGSDQVWNSIWNQGIDKAYFLDYAPADKMRIAFSASIGQESIELQEEKQIKPFLSKYSAITVREKSAVDILKSLGIESRLILDPTLMIDANEWRKIAEKIKVSFQYLLIYQLNPNSQMDEYATELAKRKKWKIIRIGFGFSDRKKNGKCVILPSVEKVLGLFDQAACVLTDSFHATAFALNLGTDFISVLPKRFGTRIESILELTLTTDRLLRNYGDFEIVNKKINKKQVLNILEEERKQGINYLTNILKKSGENI